MLKATNLPRMAAAATVLVLMAMTMGCAGMAPRISGGGPRPVVKATPALQPKLGASVWANPGETFPGAVARETTNFGRLGVLRVFATGLPKPWSTYTGATGADIVASFKAAPSEILAGKDDATLRAWFASAPTDRNVYWSYFHEPEDNIARGEFTAAEYRAAWVHLTSLARSTNPRLHATLILMNWSLEPASGRTWTDYYAGPATIDVLGWDAYSFEAAKGYYLSPDKVFGKSIAVSRAAGKPYGFGEFGATLANGDGSGRGRAAWLTAVGAYLRGSGSLWAAYFDAPIGGEFRMFDAPSAAAWRSVMGG